jgi:hypothetical protein
MKIMPGGLLAGVWALGCGGNSPLNNHFVTSDAGAGTDAASLLTCGQVEPCGGDLVGTWDLTGGCVNQTALSASVASMVNGCSGLTVAVSGFMISGSITFNADMSYSTAGAMESFMFTETLPASCIGGLSCALLSSQLSSMLQANPQPGITFISCTGSSSCACSFDAQVAPTGEAGTYTISGHTVTTMPTAASASATDYCVQGTQLHVISLDTTMHTGPMGQATIDADIVANKR